MRNNDEKERRKLNRKLLKQTFVSEMKEPKFRRFANEYSGIGMCIGVSLGIVFDNLFSAGNVGTRMCIGIAVGLCLGGALGQAKDKRLLENTMKISKIENLAGFSEVFIYAIDKDGIEKQFRVSEKLMKSEKFKVGDKVAEERDGVLISLMT